MPAAPVFALPLGEVIKITLPGDPIGKGRPRARIVTTKTKGQFISFYTPAETVTYEQALAWAGKAAMKGRKPLLGALRVTVKAFMVPPESWSGIKRTKALNDEIRPSVKPDADNILKILDALNKIVWHDDAQIVDARIEKRYWISPSLNIQVEEL
jgi:Holliday junction resolvase RusA-like endonuclease